MTDLRQLRALTAVIDEGTFTDAAIALRTSQASVSRAVAELERTLGVRLLLRTSLGARPTVLGRRVAEHARRVLAEIALIEGLAEQRPAVLRVGFAWSVFGRLTTPIQRSSPAPASATDQWSMPHRSRSGWCGGAMTRPPGPPRSVSWCAGGMPSDLEPATGSRVSR